MVAFSTYQGKAVTADAKPLVLVAVSQRSVRDAIDRALSHVDGIVIETTTADAAMQLLLRLDIDLIVTDAGGLEAVGPNLLAGLRRLPVECQRPEVIVWSALPTEAGPANATLVVPQAGGESRLAAAVEAVLDDPLGFIVKARSAR
jgi:DNA-binding NarL/FixJ family response regulator